MWEQILSINKAIDKMKTIKEIDAKINLNRTKIISNQKQQWIKIQGFHGTS